MVPDFANLFVDHNEEQIFAQSMRSTPELNSCYINDCVGAITFTETINH